MQLENKKLLIRVENLESENKKIKADFQRCHNELKEMKLQKEEEEKLQW